MKVIKKLYYKAYDLLIVIFTKLYYNLKLINSKKIKKNIKVIKIFT